MTTIECARLIAVLLLAIFGASTIADAAPGVTPVAGQALLVTLRGGGFVIYFRHASTDFSVPDRAAVTDLADCAQQRNLSTFGREQARRVGAAIRQFAIPIGEVVASPYCRTMETARLMFGRVESSIDARGGPADEGTRYGGLRRRLATTPPAGLNNVIVGHGNPYISVSGPPHLGEGEAAIVRPRGSKGFEEIARIPADQWPALER